MEELRLNIRGLRIVIIEGTSEEAAKRIASDSVDLVFIDANHKYPYIKADIINYWPKVKLGGIMLGHDYREDGKKFRGVRKAVTEFFGQSLTILEHTHIFRVKKVEGGGCDGFT